MPASAIDRGRDADPDLLGRLLALRRQMHATQFRDADAHRSAKRLLFAELDSALSAARASAKGALTARTPASFSGN
jgi:hypothetical protein